jgi:hypothetical protein
MINTLKIIKKMSIICLDDSEIFKPLQPYLAGRSEESFPSKNINERENISYTISMLMEMILTQH